MTNSEFTSQASVSSPVLLDLMSILAKAEDDVSVFPRTINSIHELLAQISNAQTLLCNLGNRGLELLKQADVDREMGFAT